MDSISIILRNDDEWYSFQVYKVIKDSVNLSLAEFQLCSELFNMNMLKLIGFCV